MPELPEVETVRRGLQPVMQDRRIINVQVNRPDLRWPFPKNMAQRLTGMRVENLGRRSKYLLIALSSGETLIIHLGMSGRMQISRQRHPDPQKHDHVVFDMENGARVTFNDARRFGMMDLISSDATGEHRLLRDIGPEPLGNTFDENTLISGFISRNTPVKTALLDQRIVAGLGNIYVCEVLHRTGISPKRRASRLSPKRIATLVPAIRDVLTEAIESGGSSLNDHRQTDGELGYFQHRFRVYGRESEPCVNAGCNGKIARITQSGRSTFYCPQCQR